MKDKIVEFMRLWWADHKDEEFDERYWSEQYGDYATAIEQLEPEGENDFKEMLSKKSVEFFPAKGEQHERLKALQQRNDFIRFVSFAANILQTLREVSPQQPIEGEIEEIYNKWRLRIPISVRKDMGVFKYFKAGYKKALSKGAKPISKGCECKEPPRSNQNDKIIRLCGRCGNTVQTEI